MWTPLSDNVTWDACTCRQKKWGRTTTTVFHLTVPLQFRSVQFSSVQFKIVSMRSGRPVCAAPPSRRSFLNVALETVPTLVWWLTMVPFSSSQTKIVERFLFLRLSPFPGDRWWCDVPGFVPAGSVSSFSTLQIFRDASRLWRLLCLNHGRVHVSWLIDWLIDYFKSS